MHRTQIQLTKKQIERLRRLSAQQRVSLAQLIRQAVDDLLARTPGDDPDAARRRAMEVVGRYRSGLEDLAADHDRHLGEALNE